MKRLQTVFLFFNIWMLFFFFNISGNVKIDEIQIWGFVVFYIFFDFHKIWEIWGKGFYLWVSSMKYVCIHLCIITGAWLLVYISGFSLSVYSSVNYYLTHIRFPTVWYTGPVIYVLIGQEHSLWNAIDLLSVIQTCFSCRLIHDHCLCVQNGQTCI